ncbi:MAG: aspartate carbamoyltransferase [Dehalococcoidia bacterium]|nr:aspartate carbamoyltransferase [Dehalococcoidia bacterium]|tara:strand:+ start:7653 stop:8675 length:1023 start_codon:yes stop_codon:yes gene_type:complete
MVSIKPANSAGTEVGQPQGAPEPPTTVWALKDLLDTNTLSMKDLELVFETTDTMVEVRERPVGRVATLRGTTVVTLFYENSTRTRASFEIAAKALGADVINLAAATSSVGKGESLVDTVRTIEAVGADILVIRHPGSGAATLAARHTNASVINGGDGAHAHPTQALLDLYTMRQHVGDLEHRKVVIVGDVLHSRVARSNLWALRKAGAQVTLCGPSTLLPRSLESLPVHEGAGTCRVTSNLGEALEEADIVMALRIQRERQEQGLLPSLREYIRNYQITEERLGNANPNALVMHPGPMNEGVEISPEVAHGLRSVVREQVANGVAVRMAILFLMATARRR